MDVSDHMNYVAPDSLEMAVDYLVRNENVAVLAGGTDVVPQIKYRIRRPTHLLSLNKIGSLRDIAAQEDCVHIGAMVTLNEMAKHNTIIRHFPSVAESARRIASPQIRNLATIGGNLLQDRRCLYFNQSEYWRDSISPCLKLGGKICHQVPNSQTCRALYHSDLAPVLLGYDAKVEVYDESGAKVVSLADILHDPIHGLDGPYLLSKILVPHPPPGTWGTFLKYSVRAAIDFPTVNVAVRYSPFVTIGRQDPVVKIFVGAVAPQPLRLEETERYLIANLWGLQGLEGEIRQMALKEVAEKSALIRETAVSMEVKKNAMHIISQALDALFRRLNTD